MEQEPSFFNRPTLVLNTYRKTKKHVKKPKMNISRKALLRVEEDLKAEYKKYVNSIKRRKLCKVKSFRVFANERMGKKSRRNVKKSVEKPEEKSFFSLPSSESSESSESSPAEPVSVVPPPVEESNPPSEQKETPAVESNTGESSSEQLTEPVAEESKPAEPLASEEETGIIKSITDTLGLSATEKKGGKKHKRSSRRHSRK